MMLELSDLTVKTISSLLDENDLKNQLDDNEDINMYFIDHNIAISLRIDKKKKILRFSAWVFDAKEYLGDKKNIINFINTASSTVKYSVLSSGTILIEYGIPLIGKVDDKHLVGVTEHIIERAKAFNSTYPAAAEILTTKD